MEIIFAFCVVVLITTLVGHGLWVFFAWMFRGFRPAGRGKLVSCPKCGAAVLAFPCSRCGYGASETNRRLVVTRTLDELVRGGALSPQVKLEVEKALARAQGPAVTPPPVARPMVAEPVSRPPVGPVPEAQLAADESTVAEEQKPPIAIKPAVPTPPPSRAAHTPPRMPPQVAVPMPPRYVAPAPPPPQSKPFSQVFRGFMEERNIRWGELIGGMLIVGCSVALVISLWAQISQRPFLKVTVFTGVVASLFGLGLYSDRKWKLPTTSFAILIIAMLMVPLHFSGMVVIGGEHHSAAALAVEAAGVALLAFLAHLAAGVIAPAGRQWRTMLAAGVVVVSLLGPLLHLSGVMEGIRTVPGLIASALLIIGALVAFTMPVVWSIAKMATWEPARNRQAATVLGILLFAALPSLAMHAYFASSLTWYRYAIAPALALMAIPVLTGAGVLLARVKREDGWTVWLWGVQIVAASGLGVFVFWGWPMPLSVVSTALVGACILSGIGVVRRETLAFVPVYVLVIVAYLAALPAVLGRVFWLDQAAPLLERLETDGLGMEVQPLVLLLGLIGLALMRRVPDAMKIALGFAGTVAGLAMLHLLGEVYLRGVDVRGAGIVLGIYAATCIAAGLAAPNRWAAAIGTGLLVLTAERIWPGQWAMALLGVSSLWALVGMACSLLKKPEVVKASSSDNAWWTLAAGAIAALLQLGSAAPQVWANYSWWMTGIALGMLVGGERRPTAALAKLVVVELLLCASTILQTLVIGRGHYAWDDQRLWFTCGVALVGLAILRAAACMTGKRIASLASLLALEFAPIRVVGIVASIAVTCGLFAWFSAAAGSEISDARDVQSLYTGLATPGFHGTWIVMALVTVLGVIEAMTSGQMAFLVLTVAGTYGLASVLLVGRMPEYAASGIRFACTGVLAVFSVLRWTGAGRSGGSWGDWLCGKTHLAIVLAGGLAPVILLTATAAAARFAHEGPRAPVSGSLLHAIGAFGSYIVPLVVLSLVLAGHAMQRRSQWLALGAVAVCEYAVTLAFMLERGVSQFGDLQALIQLQVIAAGLCAWVWVLLRQYVLQIGRESPVGLRLLCGLCAAPVFLIALLGEGQFAAMGYSWPPQSVPALAIAWAAMLLTISLMWRLWSGRHAVAICASGLLCACVLAAQSVECSVVFVAGMWGVYVSRTLLIAHLVATWAVYLLGRWFAERGIQQADRSVVGWSRASDELRDEQGRVQLAYVRQSSADGAGVGAAGIEAVMGSVRRWGMVLAVLTFVFAARAMLHDSPWWTIGALVTLASLGVVIAQRELRPGYLYGSTICVCVAVSCLWGSHYWHFDSQRIRDLAMLNLIALAACGIISVILERQIFAAAGALVVRRLLPLHVPASIACVAGLSLVALTQLGTPQRWSHQPDAMLLSLGGCAAAGALVIARMWDVPRSVNAALLYIVTFVSLAIVLDLGDVWGAALVQRSAISAIGLTIAWGFLLRNWSELRARIQNAGGLLLPAEQLRRVNAWLGIACMIIILAHETSLAANFGRAAMELPLIIAFGVLLLVVAGAMIAVALSRISDPLHLPFRKKETYVFVAEGTLALLFLHVRLTCPELFTGVLRQFWPMIVMAISFALAALSEVLMRRGVSVVGKPAGQTAFLLPIVPAIFFGAATSQVPYWVVVSTAAIYYGILASITRSIPAAILGLLAANATVWALLWGHEGLELSRHPQLWLIPPALSMILAAQWLKDRLTAQQLAGLRYAALFMAYAGSAGDVFLVGVANAPWLAGVLGLISVVGVMAGIMLRIRSFLYTGTAFLALSLATLIYHATANLHQTWLLWLAGMALGLLILAAFAMFERHKERVTRMLDDLKGWQG